MAIAVLCLLLSAVATIPTATSEKNSQSASAAINPKLSKFKTNVHRILEGSRIRKKRQLDELNDNSDYKVRIRKATLENLPYLSNYNITFWIEVHHQNRNQVMIGTRQRHLLLFNISDVDDKTAQVVAVTAVEDVAIKGKAFSYADDQWFAILHYSNNGYYIRMYQRIGRGLEQKQTIYLVGPSDIELVSLKGMTHYLVVSSYHSAINIGFSYKASVRLYYWARTQFDEYAVRETYGARSVACWALGGSIYISVAQEKNDEENYEVGSPLYFYNSKEENRLVLWEILATYGPSKVQHFYVAGGHYVVFIGRKDAVIYWWSSGQFLEWQTLSGTAFASDLAILSLGDGEVAIVIALKEEAVFYTLDGSGYYIVTSSMSFRGSNLQSLQFIFSGKSYYALALFEGYTQSIWRMELTSVFMPSVLSLDPLRECLLNTQDLLSKRQMELNIIKSDVNRIWFRGSNQTISANVTVTGHIGSDKVSSVTHIIMKYNKLPESSMSSVIDGVTSLSLSASEVKSEMEHVVFNSTQQKIEGTKIFSDPVYVPSLTMESTAHDIRINDVPISRLNGYALRKTGNQIFRNATLVSDIWTEMANVGTLNEIPINDLLLLHGRQDVTGKLEFSNIQGNDISTETINTINVDDIVTTKSSSVISSLKTFSKLQSDVIDVTGEINGVDLGSINGKIVRTDEYAELLGPVTFHAPVSIHGDLFLSEKINGVVDLEKLFTQSVTLDTRQDLAGLYKFKQGQVVEGEMLISGSVNKVSLDQLLTLSSDQKIYADTHFTESLMVSGDLLVNTVNGADLSEDVVRKRSPNEFITGQKSFLQDITVESVDMTDYITLDGVDPSFLIQDIVQHSRGVVGQNLTELGNITVLGNLTAIEGINGYEVLDLLSSVWLRSVKQEMVIPLKAEILRFSNDLDVSRVNGLNLENIVRSYMHEEISSSKIFTNEVESMSVILGEGATINGIGLESLKAELDRYEREGPVRGKKVFQHLEVHGSVTIENLNGVAVTDILRPNAHQTILGTVSFPAEITRVHGNIELNSLSSDIFNGLILKDFFEKAVLLNSSNKTIKNKDFLHLEASHLYVPTGSMIDGISLDEVIRRIVTLNTDQLITASKSFMSTLKLNSAIVSTLNGIDISDYINNVVLIDETATISNKKFLGNVQTTNISVEGLINGIHINEMAANVFYKSKDNEVMQPFTFKKDIDIGNLLTNSVLDGVEWKDLILLHKDEILGPAWFLSNVKLGKDLFISGLLNGCDLFELGTKSIYKNKSAQVIKDEVQIRNVVVIGNIIVRNAIEIEELQKFVRISDDQVITSDVIFDSTLTVERLNLTDLSLSDINLIVQDAVRHSVPQVITGQKEFKDNLNATVLEGGDLFVNNLLGVDIMELYRTTVRSHGNKEIEGEKTFSQLVSDVVTVNGYINGLRLPRDVVLTDTSEHISSPTFFMSDVFVSTDVVVYGLIDGVDINNLISNRVTLAGDESITAELLFLEDVVLHGDMTIDGTLNEIVLELVAKMKSIHPLQGYKFFTELHVLGPISAATINGHDVSRLATNILKYNNDDFIGEIQVFEKGVYAQNSLFTEWVNNVPLRYLTEAFASIMSSLRITLGYLQGLSSTLQQQLSLQLSASNDQLSKFSHFILFQEIDIGRATKLLYGYSLDHVTKEFSHSMVMWTTQKKCVFMEQCCHLDFSYWLRVKKSGEIMADDAAESGRYYPVNNLKYPKYDDFVIWSDATETNPKWCDGKSKRMILSSYTEGRSEMLVNMENAPLLSDVKSFRMDRLYIIAAFYYDTTNDKYSRTIVYAYDEYTRQWSEYQTLLSIGVLSLDIIEYSHNFSHEVLLALGTGLATQPSYSTIYKWDNKNFVFKALQNIPSRRVPSTLWIRKNRELLLAMASVEHWPGKDVDCTELVSGGEINIYLYKKQLKWIQSIPRGGVISMVSFSVDGDTFLVAASAQHQTVYIYEWRGYSAFVEIQSIFVGEVRHLSIYWIEDNAYMSVAVVSGPSKILKMIREGHHSFPKTKFNHVVKQQKDEVSDNPKTVRNCNR